MGNLSQFEKKSRNTKYLPVSNSDFFSPFPHFPHFFFAYFYPPFFFPFFPHHSSPRFLFAETKTGESVFFGLFVQGIGRTQQSGSYLWTGWCFGIRTWVGGVCTGQVFEKERGGEERGWGREGWWGGEKEGRKKE